MKNFNNKGFALVETLVVTTFVMIIFSIIYTNFYPLLGEYERRGTYDDLDGKYAAYWFKRIIQKDSIDMYYERIDQVIDNEFIYSFSCDELKLEENKNMCNLLINRFNVAIDNSGKSQLFLTNYSLEDLKGRINGGDNPDSMSDGLIEYVKYLPEYSNASSLNGAQYRLLIEFHRKKDGNDYYAYSTIEVKK